MSGLEFTGERFIPGTRGEIWIEHWHRYHFAAHWAAGKRVLDVACGEGYGSALLARGAAQVVGVDVSPEAILHATRAYAGVANLSFMRGDCTRLPLEDASVDLVASFETLEHIAQQAGFLDEIERVLAPEGLLLLSCPNKLEYSDRRGYANEFHVRELYREELEALVAARFPAIAWCGQKPTFFSVIAPERASGAGALAEVEEAHPSEAMDRLSEPLYFLLVASRSARALEAAPPPLHVMSDRGDWVHRDYEKVMQWMQAAVEQRDALQRQLDERDRTLAALRDEAAAKEREPRRPRGWRAWLRRPLASLGLLK